MRNYEARKTYKSYLLLLTMSLLMLGNTFIAKAQSTSPAGNLEGTTWQVATTKLYPTASVVPPQVAYIFAGRGSVIFMLDSDPYDSASPLC